MRRNFEKSLAPCRLLLRYYDFAGMFAEGSRVVRTSHAESFSTSLRGPVAAAASPARAPPEQLSTFRLGAPARAAPPAKSDHCTRARVARRVLPHQRLERRQHDRHAQIPLALTTAFRLGHSPCRSVGAGVREDRAAPSASARHVAASCAIQLGTLSIVGSPRRTDMSEVGWKTEVCASSNRRG